MASIVRTRPWVSTYNGRTGQTAPGRGVREVRRIVLIVNEIFHSIQGESTHAGRPCVFVRLTGCDLRCTWCDTAYAFHDGQKMSVDDVVTALESYPSRLAELTGGEPLLQDDVYPLIDRLLGAGWDVLVETGGHLSLDRVPAAVTKIVDVKCPGSGEAARHDWNNVRWLTARDEVKFVVRDREDYDFARDAIGTHRLGARCGAVLLSPVHGTLAPERLAAWALEDGLDARVQLQVHKYIWGADARGV